MTDPHPTDDGTLHVGDELTIYQVAALKPLWLDALERGVTQVDLSAVTEIDGAGVQLLAALQRMARRDGRPLRLQGTPAEPVREALALLGAQDLLDPDDTDGPAGPAAAAGSGARHA